MYFKSKRISLSILGLTSILCSRAMFVFFDDPEGPNLLIVLVTALVVYMLSLTLYLFDFSSTGLKRLLLVISMQVLIVSIFYICLN